MNKILEQVSSEQKINRPSDTPVGFTNALRYGNVLNLLEQQRVNMNDGDIYMSVLEATHDKMNTLFGNTKELAVQASNDTVNHEQRLITNMDVRQNLELLVSMAQTKHKDGFIFSGKWTNQPPYEIKEGQAVYYQQEDIPPTIQVANPDYDPDLPVDPTTNPQTIPGPNPNLPPWNDTPPFSNENAITIRLLDGNYHDPNLSITPGNAAYTNDERNPIVQRIIPGSVSGLAGLNEKPHFNEDGVPDYDYEIDYVNGTLTLLSDKAKAAFFNETTGEAKPPEELPNMSFEYVYRNSIDMTGEIYREIDNGITMKINTNPDDLFGRGGLNDTDSFKEIISLMQGLWYNDQPQISKGIETVDAAKERNLEQQAVEGAKLKRLEIVFDRNKDLEIDNTRAHSELMDVNFEEIMTQLMLAQAVYDASLYATSSVLNRSLMDYL